MRDGLDSLNMYWLASHVGDDNYINYSDLQFFTDRKARYNNFYGESNFYNNLMLLTMYNIIEHDTTKLPIKMRSFKLTKKGINYLADLTIQIFARTEDGKWLLNNKVDNISYASMLKDKYGL